jgi:transcriptional regulator with XRE-family HTH domain
MTPMRLRVREMREAKGWTQRDLAREADVRQATVSKAEAGESITLATLVKLADALGVRAAFLIDHEPTTKRRKG